jgi:hypothetical protein
VALSTPSPSKSPLQTTAIGCSWAYGIQSWHHVHYAWRRRRQSDSRAQTFSTINSPQTAALADFNGDGRLDVVMAGAALSVMLQTELLVTPQVENFGDHALGTTSGEHYVDLTNIGSASLGLGTITVSGVNQSEFELSTTCLSTSQPSHTCMVRVTFSPAAEGLRSATLEIPNLSKQFTQSVSMSGIGTISDVSPSALSFGTTQVGKASGPQIITVENKYWIRGAAYCLHTDREQRRFPRNQQLPGDSGAGCFVYRECDVRAGCDGRPGWHPVDHR